MPFSVTEYRNQEIYVNNTCTIDNKEKDEILKQNLSKLSSNHMISEERNTIFDLKFRDIFYTKHLPLTFTNQVKHKIRTVNEDPI